MKRKTYEARLTYGNGVTLSTRRTYAWNSGVRATEAMMREYARGAGLIFTGAAPDVLTTTSYREYRREWTGQNGETFWALVRDEGVQPDQQ